MRFVIYILALFITVFMTNTSFASFTSTASCSSVGATSTITVASITVPTGAKVGDQLSAEFDGPGVNVMRCTSTSNLTYQGLNIQHYGEEHVSVVNNRYIYATGIKGIGFSLGAYSNSCSGYTSDTWVHTMQNTTASQKVCTITTNFVKNFTGYPMVQFYKIADNASDTKTSLSGAFIGYMLGRTNETGDTGTYDLSPINLTINKIISGSCSVTTNPVSVNLGTVNTQDFKTTIGSYTGSDPQEFNIGFNCTTSGMPVSISITGGVAAATIAQTLNGIMGLTSGGATGVGIQILDSTRSSPFPLGEINNVISSSISGVQNVKLYARYVQIPNKTITSGQANATATFTVTYQ